MFYSRLAESKEKKFMNWFKIHICKWKADELLQLNPGHCFFFQRFPLWFKVGHSETVKFHRANSVVGSNWDLYLNLNLSVTTQNSWACTVNA